MEIQLKLKLTHRYQESLETNFLSLFHKYAFYGIPALQKRGTLSGTFCISVGTMDPDYVETTLSPAFFSR